jgi:anti-anti-sigma regulatory factor
LDDERQSIADCSLYQELHSAALADLTEGETLVLNFGLVDWFPTAFYRLLLRVREAAEAHRVQLLLCCLTPNVREGFDVMGGSRVFEVRASEARAVSEARR